MQTEPHLILVSASLLTDVLAIVNFASDFVAVVGAAADTNSAVMMFESPDIHSCHRWSVWIGSWPRDYRSKALPVYEYILIGAILMMQP